MDMNAPIGAALMLDRKALFAALRTKGSPAFGKALTPSQVQGGGASGSHNDPV